jgi:protein-S-isoprenylcysteine O-methyltransferase Ste14
MINGRHIKNLIFSHRFGSGVGTVFFTFWILQRIFFYYDHLFRFSVTALIWWLITLQFFLFTTAYLTRTEAHAHATGFIETIFPFLCAAMPFALIVTHPYLPSTYRIVSLKPLSITLVIGGTLFIIAGIIFLRKSFSIMTEVRRPIFRGIYRVTRHPMYLGSIMTTLGTLFQNFNVLNLLLFVLFCAFQTYRALREENKIISIYPEYQTYAASVGWFWILGRRK